jgi:hypothetical protein
MEGLRNSSLLCAREADGRRVKTQPAHASDSRVYRAAAPRVGGVGGSGLLAHGWLGAENR